MDDTAWRKVAKDSELREGVPVAAPAGEEKILLVRFQGKVRAFVHECPHYRGKLEEGVLLGSELICPLHHARFDVTNGKMTAPPALDDLSTYPVKVEAGEVWVGQAVKPARPKPQGADPRTFLIVGAGAAGNAAAESLRREGFAGRIVMVTEEDERPYDRPNLSKDFISGKVKAEWLPLRGSKFYSNQGIELFLNHRVVSLDPGNKSVAFQDGETLAFDSALLATGGKPREPSILGAGMNARSTAAGMNARSTAAAADGCFTLRSAADARAIVSAASRFRGAAVIGAGFIGLELASSLRALGLAVDLVSPEALPLAHIFGDRVAAYMKRRHEENGVRFHLGRTVAEISGEPGALDVRLSDGAVIPAGFVVFGLGIRPAVDYLAGTGLVEDGAVPVDGTLRTRAPGIFAAGDIAVVPGLRGGAARRIEHWTVAERQGRHAARAMLGSSAPYDETPFFWTRQTGVSLKYVGFAPGFDQVAYRGAVEEGKFLAGYYVKGALEAAATIGRGRELIALERLLRAGASVPFQRFADEGFDLLREAAGV